MEHPVTEGDAETQRWVRACPGPPSPSAIPLCFGSKSEFVKSKDVRAGTPIRTGGKGRLREAKRPVSQTAGWNQSSTHDLEVFHLQRQPRRPHKAGAANSST